MNGELSAMLKDREVRILVWGDKVVLGATSNKRKQCEALYSQRKFFDL